MPWRCRASASSTRTSSPPSTAWRWTRWASRTPRPGSPSTDPARLGRIRDNIEKALRGEIWLEKALAGRRSLPKRADVFQVEPRVLIDNAASRTHSVIEVNGRDRPGLLFDLAKSLKDLGLVIHSAHISTYGERVVDVFYVKDVFGLKIAHRSKMQRVQKAAGRGADRRMSVGRAALTVGGLTGAVARSPASPATC